jgi:hypothetical protein
MKNKFITYIWQMGKGSGIFRFQTTDPKIARKLTKSKGWKSIVSCCNRPIWIFQKSFPRPQDARKKLKSLCQVQKLQKGEDTGEFFAETYANTTPKIKPELRKEGTYG